MNNLGRLALCILLWTGSCGEPKPQSREHTVLVFRHGADSTLLVLPDGRFRWTVGASMVREHRWGHGTRDEAGYSLCIDRVQEISMGVPQHVQVMRDPIFAEMKLVSRGQYRIDVPDRPHWVQTLTRDPSLLVRTPEEVMNPRRRGDSVELPDLDEHGDSDDRQR